MTDDIPTFGNDEWDKEKKGILNDLRSEREKRHQLEEKNTALEQRLAVIEESLTTAGEDGESPQDRVNRLANDPDGYISDHLVNFEETRLKPLQQEVEMLKIDRSIEKGLRWVAKQMKKDYEDVAGSDVENELARVTQEMRARGIVPTNPEEGTKEAFRMWQKEQEEKENREKERDQKIEGNRTETVSTPVRTGSRRWTREEVNAMSAEEFTKNEAEIRQAALSWK